MDPPSPKVIVSYSHDSPEHMDRVLDLANRLRADGIDCALDQYESSPPEGWPRWTDRHVRTADFVLLVCTATYRRRVLGEEEPSKGLGVRWEGHLIYQHLYDLGTVNHRFVPVLLEGGDPAHIPEPVRGVAHYRPHTAEGYEELYRRLTNQPRHVKPVLGKLRALPPKERHPNFPSARGTCPTRGTRSSRAASSC